MAFTINDLEEMMRLLDQHPEKREALRLILLGRELLELPEKFTRFIEVFERLVQIVERHEQTLQQHEQTLQRHEQILQNILEVQERHERTLQHILEVLEQYSQMFQDIYRILNQHTQEIRDLRQYVERMANAYGLTLEGEAEDAVGYLAQQKGWKFLRLPHPLRLNDGEIDLIAVCEDAQGQQFTLIVEVKARLASQVVRDWANRVRSEGFRERITEMGYAPPYRMYIMGFRIDPPSEQTAREMGVGLFTGRGERVESELFL